ncbi:MAG: glycosyltransferase family 2 protein [Acidimicrobiales bacterium]
MSPFRFCAIVTGVVYLTWRLIFTWEGANPVLFFLLLAAEAFGFVRVLTETSLLGDVRPAIRNPEKTMAPDGDVILVVTDEPASEVHAAVLSARVISGYNNLRIVDRDNRPDVANLARRLGLVRIVGSPRADLGELIDRAMGDCTSLFALLMPADLVVMPDILEVTASAFDDPSVAVVACRVENVNAVDAVDFGGYGEHRRRDELMVAKLDDAEALPWWPGLAVVRRSAVSEIGGMSRGRQGVTMSTGVRLQAVGWKITDVPVIVGRRLAPWTDDRHLHRWARDLHERLSVLVDDEAPHRNEHATPLRRRVYRAADLHIGRSIQRLVLLGVLFTVLYSSSLPLVADARVLVPLWGAWQFASLLYRRKAQEPVGFTNWITNDLRLLSTDLYVAFRALPGKPLGVDLVDRAPGRIARTVFLVGLQIALAGSLAVFGLGIARPPHGDFATLASLAVAAWLWGMSLQARTASRLHQKRQNFRASDELRVLASKDRMGVIGVSPFGIDVVSADPLGIGEKVRLAFALPQADGSSIRFDCPTAVRRCSKTRGAYVSYLRFAQLSDAEVDQIAEYTAVVAGVHGLRDNLESPLEHLVPIEATLVKPRAEVAEV